MKKVLISIFAISILAVSCAKIYTSPNANETISRQGIIAIAPPVESILAYKNVEADALIEQQKTKSKNFH